MRGGVLVAWAVLLGGCFQGNAKPEIEPEAATSTGVEEETTSGNESTSGAAGTGGASGGASDSMESATTDPGEDVTGGEATSSTSEGADDTGDEVEGGCIIQRTAILTDEGELSASSVFEDDVYPASLAGDGDLSTSWFSAGSADPVAVLTWDAADEFCLDRIDLRGNAAHFNPDFRTDFGFEAAHIRVYDAQGEVTWDSGELSLRGTPDPDIELLLDGQVGLRVEVELTGHESDVCGGLSEFSIRGRPTADG